MWIHLAARASVGRPLVAADAAWWAWRALRRRWPDALAACLMPDHLHLLLLTRDPDAELRSLARLLGAFSRHVEHSDWRVGAPELVKAPDHLRRSVRYIHLNPCRARLADDPLAWSWSTHRGLVGAEANPWVPAERLARHLASSPDGFARQLHRFVSGDPSVCATGSPFPKPAPRRATPDMPLSTIIAAAAAATPWSNRATFHRAAAQLATHQGWQDPNVVAEAMAISARNARRLATATDDGALLAAAALCLGDERLRRHEVPARPRSPERRSTNRARAALPGRSDIL